MPEGWDFWKELQCEPNSVTEPNENGGVEPGGCGFLRKADESMKPEGVPKQSG
jgi:hypothetical protein